ncbi:hypothetical protein ABK040_012563 [Willaertia magna]
MSDNNNGGGGEQQQFNKPHKARRAGNKFKKKEIQRKKKLGISEEQQKKDYKNPRAFALGQGQAYARELKYKLDKFENKLHAPIKKRVYGEPPPKLVAIVGPPNSGKTTLTKSLIKFYTKQSVTEITGPITVRTGKTRTTFFDCPNDLNAMIDISKVADLVLLLIDASFGFEMENFEFLNLLQTHGMTRVIGVLTNLDKINKIRQVKKLKKKLKSRFWTEVCEGAKLFYLSGLRNNLYTNREITNLSRCISVVKPRPLKWRVNHSCVIADRFEDLTNQELIEKNPKVYRHVSFYGYVRNTFLKKNNTLHIPGCGDFTIKTIKSLEDPLPPKPNEKKNSKLDKFRGLYGPMSNLGTVYYEKENIYIETNGLDDDDDTEELVAFKKGKKLSKEKVEERENEKQEKEKILNHLMESGKEMNRENVQVRLLSGKQVLNLLEKEEEVVKGNDGTIRRRLKLNDNDDDDKAFEGVFGGNGSEKNKKEKIEYDDDDEDDKLNDNDYFEPKLVNKNKESTEDDIDDLFGDDEYGNASQKWKESLQERASQLFYDTQTSLQQLIYDENDDDNNNEEEEDDYNNNNNDLNNLFDFKKNITLKKKEILLKKLKIDFLDRTRIQIEPNELKNDWDNDEIKEQIRNKFVTGDWSTRRTNPSTLTNNKKRSNEMNDDNVEEGQEEEENEEMNNELMEDDENIKEENDVTEEEFKKLKELKKKQFDQSFDNKTIDNTDDNNQDNNEDDPILTIEQLKKKLQQDDPQTILNKTEFEGLPKEQREEIEGFSPGTYVRIELENFPSEFIENVNFKNPILLGALHQEECRMGLIKLRLKRHRWYPKTLKNKDPLIFSIGWRRFQSIPTYCVQDPNGRNRMIKYTPDYMHCIATIYGPYIPQNTGVIAFQNINNNVNSFRVSATGYVMELDQDFSIVKKLKLVGYPKIIHKNTCIVTKMFHSELEIAKYEGASLRTVSGLRGSVKKAYKGDNCLPGDFRATFEDKILKSDIIFLRCWYAIELERFYNPVYNHLTMKWYGMRTTFEIRKLNHVAIPVKDDSKYRDHLQKTRSTVGHDLQFKPKPNQLKNLPFKEQSKKVIEITGLTDNLNNYVNESSTIYSKLTSDIMSEKEIERTNMLRKLEVINMERLKKKRMEDIKMKMKILKHEVKEEREKNKSKQEAKKRRYIKQELLRVKKAKYVGAGNNASSSSNSG